MTIGRRELLKGAGAAGGVLLVSSATPALAATEMGDPGGIEFNGMLIDTTKCIGCRACEAACNEANHLPEPEVSFDSDKVFAERRDTGPGTFVVVNRFDNEKNPDEPTFVRKQCLHCNQPGCASACLCKAFEKTKEGAVIYHKGRCMGCRYCMIACPFDVPKYEYSSPTPYVKKCTFCYERQKQGLQPACAEACPTGATLFGKKRELLEIAKKRVYSEPEKYNQAIYGEHEVGGTGFLYLTAASPEKLGMKTDLGTTPLPELTKGFLYGVPLVFVLWPSVLYGLNYMVKEPQGEKGGEEHGAQE